LSEELTVEATGETVGEAKWAAVRELERLAPGLDRERIRFEVLSEGERGLLGVGYTPARVAAAATRPTSARPSESESEPVRLVRELLERVAVGIGIPASVRVVEHDDAIEAELIGSELGLAIGRHGHTIDAIQYLANAALHRRVGPTRPPVVVDAGGYRQRRTATLHAVAGRTAERVAATGLAEALEPMTAVERKIVHEFLKEDPEVDTASEGTEPNRHVVVVPRRSL
jgi:spoIIIJ-associated protein